MTAERGPAAVRAALANARAAGHVPLIAYLMAGFPDQATSIEAAAVAVEGGATVLEIGIPFSDPVADGPVIAAAGREALAAGGGFDSAAEVVAALRSRGVEVPILAMSYLNPLVARGQDAALAALRDAGADGLIVPDLPAGEEVGFEHAVADMGLATCFLVAPNTSDERVERAIAASTGFVYVVPLYGVTGARDRITDTAVPLLRRIRDAADGRVPVAVGFGVSRREHVVELGAVADGVVVGSALLSALGEGGPQAVGRVVAELVLR